MSLDEQTLEAMKDPEILEVRQRLAVVLVENAKFFFVGPYWNVMRNFWSTLFGKQNTQVE